MLRGLLRACHPGPSAAVTLIAALLAVSGGRPAPAVALVAATVLATQLCVGWSNDWLDAARDAAVGRPDKPIATGAVPRRVVGLASILAGLASVPLALSSGGRAAAAILLALVSALAYNWPLKSTPASPLPYMVSFAALPAFVEFGDAASPAWWLVVAGGLLGGGAHFANALPDLADDERTGVRGLPHRLGAVRSAAAGAVLLLGATATLAFGPPGAPSWLAWATLGVAVGVPALGWYASGRVGYRALFRAVMVVALADVILLLISGTGR